MDGFDEAKYLERKVIWDAVKARSNGLCECCGMEIPLAKFKYLDENGVRQSEFRVNGSVHHRHMRQFGGPDSIHNLIHLWHPHHKRIHKTRETERVNGFSGLIAWGDAKETPLLLHGDRWVLLDDEGNYIDIPEGKARSLIYAFSELEPSYGDTEMDLEGANDQYNAQLEHVDLGRGIRVDQNIPIVILSTLTPPKRGLDIQQDLTTWVDKEVSTD